VNEILLHCQLEFASDRFLRPGVYVMEIKKLGFVAILLPFFCLLFVADGFAQTSAFSYQGRLNDAGSPANGTYFLQFKLFDAASGGTQIGSTIPDISVTVSNGGFSTSLDFGPGPFSGANRFLEISVKKLAADPYVVLSPRQQILTVPYSIKSKSADDSSQLGGLDSSRFVQQDAGGNVSIGGNLTVSGTTSYNIINAQSQYNLNGQRILGTTNGNSNLLLGISAGQSLTTGFFNTFLGNATGVLTTTACCNTFVGTGAGNSNTTGGSNSFFGFSAGSSNTTGSQNSFFGLGAGQLNVIGNNNAFFGVSAGVKNTASENSFFGAESGLENTTGVLNSFFGRSAGFSNTTGSQNSFFGSLAGNANTTGQANSVFGADAGKSNTGGVNNAFFGASAGNGNQTGGANAFFGALSGFLNNGSNNAFFGHRAGFANQTGFNNVFFGSNTGDTNTTGSNNTLIGANAQLGANNLTFASVFGAGASVSTNNTVVLGRNLDTVQIPGNLNVGGNLAGGNIVNNLNGLTGNITLAAGANITLTPAGNTLTIASTGGGGNPILNQTTLQTSANFNIDGTGRANIFNANTQFNLGGNRILSGTSETGTANLFAGFSAGASTTGGFNAFVGTFAGQHNTSGGNNSYFGVNAGGGEGSAGTENTFIGNGAGFADGDGNRLTYIGVNTGNAPGFTLTNATAIGANARVTQNNSLVLGSINGVNGGIADTNVGVGTTAPKAKLHVQGGNLYLGAAGQGIILKSPDGATCRLLSIDNTGVIVLTTLTCP